MSRIIRERYENGILVERTIEGSNTTPWHWLTLVVHTVIAISLAVLAAVAVHDSLTLQGDTGRRGRIGCQLRTATVPVVGIYCQLVTFDLENLMVRLFVNAAVAGAIALSISTHAIARDPGVNQPGRAGNTGVGRDPGINQPGAAGNVGVGAPGAGARDPGFNQPGAAGNVGVGAPGAGVRDPGINQPGAAGNTTPGNRGGPVDRAGRR